MTIQEVLKSRKRFRRKGLADHYPKDAEDLWWTRETLADWLLGLRPKNCASDEFDIHDLEATDWELEISAAELAAENKKLKEEINSLKQKLQSIKHNSI